MRIETATGSEKEERTRLLLAELLEEYDTSRWQFTDRVIIDERSLGHSHPVLTLGTRFPVRTRIGVLSSFLHEQIHWYLGTQRRQCSAAIDELRVMYPDAPDATGGGARDQRSTYLHLVVNWLEIEGLRSVVGSNEADDTLQAACRGGSYTWIYKRVLEQRDVIGKVIQRHGLDSVLNDYGLP